MLTRAYNGVQVDEVLDVIEDFNTECFGPLFGAQAFGVRAGVCVSVCLYVYVVCVCECVCVCASLYVCVRACVVRLLWISESVLMYAYLCVCMCSR